MHKSVLPAALSARGLSGSRRSLLSRFLHPEYVYPSLLLLWGAILALLLPPLQCPDEGSHAIRTFHLSRGRIHPDGVKKGLHLGRAPVPVLRLCGLMVPRTFMNYPLRRLTPEEFQYFSTVRLESAPEEPAWYGMMSYTCFVPYVPQALGVAVVRILGGSVLTAFYAGRLGNLFCCVLALHLALRLMPFYKNLLGAVALLPTAVQQSATLSADALGIASCFVFIALALRLLVPGRRPGPLHLVGLCGVGLLLPLCKIPYAVLTLLYLAVPASRLGSLRRYLLVGAALAGMTVLGTCITLEAAQGATRLGEGIPTPEVSRSRQLENVCQHPGAFAATLGRTFASYGWSYCETLAILSGNAFVSHASAKPYFLLLALLALVDRRDGWIPGMRARGLALFLVALALLVFHLMLYLVWTRVGAPVIEGFQGRYFIGFLPVLLLPLYNRMVRVQSRPRALMALSAAGATGVQLASLYTLGYVYYLAPGRVELEPHSWGALLAGALLVLTALLIVCWRAQQAEAVMEQLSRPELLPASILPPGKGGQAASPENEGQGQESDGREEPQRLSQIG